MNNQNRSIPQQRVPSPPSPIPSSTLDRPQTAVFFIANIFSALFFEGRKIQKCPLQNDQTDSYKLFYRKLCEKRDF